MNVAHVEVVDALHQYEKEQICDATDTVMPEADRSG